MHPTRPLCFANPIHCGVVALVEPNDAQRQLFADYDPQLLGSELDLVGRERHEPLHREHRVRGLGHFCHVNEINVTVVTIMEPFLCGHDHEIEGEDTVIIAVTTFHRTTTTTGL
eukprot:CAMPEP_0185784316 /NCGR_PEP_ID=MMETSP1174-20130828/122446_1 /TAXON_ID=35687 /ORGANISM="Dictyocha speculum, Strain CCMP1381" /LENGTH=113 /DNA_ID=CAMNT_0028475833 /DNA_START=76 /DNA_END=417 /DNA_ORIENTATION=+